MGDTNQAHQAAEVIPSKVSPPARVIFGIKPKEENEDSDSVFSPSFRSIKTHGGRLICLRLVEADGSDTSSGPGKRTYRYENMRRIVPRVEP